MKNMKKMKFYDSSFIFKIIEVNTIYTDNNIDKK